MKNRFIVLLLLLVPLAGVQAQTNTQGISLFLSKLDTEYGFRDLKFEQSIDSCKGMTFLEEDGNSKFYSRKDDSLELGGAKLKSIEYEFYKGKLATITITAEPESNATLLKEFEQRFGPTQKSPHNQNKGYWFGDKVTGDYTLTAAGHASVSFWCKSLQKQRAEDTNAKR